MKRLIALPLLMILVAGNSLAAAEGRILYLTVKYAGGSVSLEDISVVDGTLKQPREDRLTPGRFHFAVTTEAGDKLFEGTVPDPTLLHVEYSDEDGRLQRKTARQDPVSFTIRVPYDPRSHRVTIRRIDTVVSDAAKLGSQTDLIGTLLIDEEVRNHD